MSLKFVARKSDARASRIKGRAVKTRRRGEALEETLLEAAWAELLKGGYSAFTIEGVALQAQTSRPVIARRWSSRGDLALAAFKHYITSRPLLIPEESDIRTELLDYIDQLYERDFPLVIMMWTQMDEYYRAEKSSPALFRENLVSGQASAVRFLLERAVKRGEVDARRLTEMVVSIPVAFMSYFTAAQARRDIGAIVEEMVDGILLPLVGTKAYLKGR